MTHPSQNRAATRATPRTVPTPRPAFAPVVKPLSVELDRVPVFTGASGVAVERLAAATVEDGELDDVTYFAWRISLELHRHYSDAYKIRSSIPELHAICIEPVGRVATIGYACRPQLERDGIRPSAC